MATYFHYTDRHAYKLIVGGSSDSGRLLPSGVFNARPGDMDYGTGWYITPLPPPTKTEMLLTELWKGDRDMLPRTEYWLKLDVDQSSVTHPDPARPSVALIPYYNRRPSVDGASVSIVGSFAGEVGLREAGRRTQHDDGRVTVECLYKTPRGVTRSLVEPFIAMITGLRHLSTLERRMLRSMYKIEDDGALEIEFEELIDESDRLFRAGELTKAMSSVQRAIDLKPDAAEGWRNKGAILAGLGRRKDALHAYDRAIALDPWDAASYRNAAASLLKLGRLDDASAMCGRGLDVAPRDAELWTNKGAIENARGNEAAALEALQTALQIDPSVPQAWKNIGDIHARSASLRQALESYARAVELDPAYVNATKCLRIIVALAVKGLPSTWECEDMLWRAVRADPSCLEAIGRRLVRDGVELHPRFRHFLESAAVDLSQEAVARVTSEAMAEFIDGRITVERLSDPDAGRLRIGVCMLADSLARCGLSRLPAQLGESVRIDNPGVWREEILLQVAKTLSNLGISLRRASAYEAAIDAYRKAMDLYAASRSPKWVGHMMFNIGVAYAMRKGDGDRDCARQAFDAAFEHYTNAGLPDERRQAEREAQQLVGRS